VTRKRSLLAALGVLAAAASVLGASGARAGAVPASSGTFAMTSEPGDYIGQGQSYSFTAPADPIQFGAMDWGEVRVSLPTGDFWMVRLSAPGGAALVPGDYENATDDIGNPTYPGLWVTGAGRACDASGRFTVLSVTYGPFGYVESLHATFEQRCGVATAALRGEIDLVAPPPPPPLEVHLTFDSRRTSLDRADGTVKLRGTIACSQSVPASVSADISEETKKGSAFGGGSFYVPDCSPTPTSWLIKASSSNGVPFAPGTLQVTLFGQAVDNWYTAYHDNVRLIVITDMVSAAVSVKP